MGVIQLSLIGLIFVMGYLGILYLVLFLRFRTRLEYLYFSLLNFDWIGHCYYVWMRFHVHDQLAVNHAHFYRENFEFGGILLLLLFIKEFLGLSFKGMILWITATIAVLFILHLNSAVSLHFSRVIGVERTVYITGEEGYNVLGTLSPWYPTFIASCIAVFLWGIFHSVRSLSGTNRQRGTATLISFSTLIPIVLFSVAGDVGILPALPLLSHAIVGLIISMSFMMTDEITQLAQLRIKLAESQRQIADAVPGAVFQIYADSQNQATFRFVNQGMHTLLGLDIAEHDSWEKFTQSVFLEDRQRLDEQFSRCLQNPQLCSQLAVRFEHAHKGLLWIRIECAHTLDEHGLLVTGIILDESNTHKLEQEREQAMKELEIRSEEQESVLYATSHDLKAPLVNIRGFANELEEALRAIRNLNPELEKNALTQEKIQESAQVIGFIQRNMSRMESLIQNLLHVMRAGRVPLRMESVNLNSIVQNVLQVLHHQIQKSGAKVLVNDLPKCHADSMQMEMIFTNIIDNAIKFRKQNSTCVIEIGHKIEGESVLIYVRDDGRGFDQRYAIKIFELFHRLNPIASEVGDGIGLTLVRRAIMRQGGSIWAESELGKGSIFWLQLKHQ